jgi:hypothetical protein
MRKHRNGKGLKTCGSKRILAGKGESESGCVRHSARRGTP